MTMNRTIKVLNTVMYAALLAQPLLQLTSCAEQTDISRTAGAGAEPIVIHFDTQGFTDNTTSGNTRANNGAGHGEAGTTVAAGDQFTVWFKSGSTVQSAVYTVQSDLTTAKVVPSADNPQPYFLDGATTAEVGGAYYPAMKPMAPARFSVQSDQCTESQNAVSQAVTGDARYRASDLMFAAGAISNSPKPATGATLTFQHRMAMLTVQITNKDAANEANNCPIQECYIVGGACRTVRIADPTTLTPGYETDSLVTEAAPLKLWYTNSTTYKNTSYGWHASCLLPPQRIGRQTTAGTPERFLRIKHATGEYTYFRIHPVTLLSGRHYTIKLTLRPWMKGRTLTLSSWDGTGTCTLTAVDQTYGDAATGLYSVGGVTFKMKKVSGGDYSQKRQNTTFNGHLADFWMAETETTQGLYKAVMGTLPKHKDTGAELTQNKVGDDYPCGWLVAQVAYGEDGQNSSFIDALNKATEQQRPAGWFFDLPTEAQWEWAAYGGLHRHSPDYTYSGGNTGADVAVTGGIGRVATKRANELGLYDMTGNMWEQCKDRFEWNSYNTTQTLSVGDYYAGPGGSQAAVRGGNFSGPAALPARFGYSSTALWPYDYTISNSDGGSGTNYYNTIRLVLVEVKSLASLKQCINNDNMSLARLALGQYVDGSGNIQPTAAGAVGRIVAVQQTAVDASFPDSRIMVMATEDAVAGGSNTVNWYKNQSDGGSDFTDTNALNGYQVTEAKGATTDYPAMYYSRNYAAARPTGASTWFLPSYAQYMLLRANGFATVFTAHIYWLSTRQSHNMAYMMFNGGVPYGHFLDWSTRNSGNAGIRTIYVY